MNERTLVKVCLIGSVLGIISLYFLSFMLIPLDAGAGQISRNHIGRKVTLTGTIQDIRIHSSGHIFFELHDRTGSADVVMWEDTVEQLELSGVNMSRFVEGAGITITGDVEYYRGGVQVVV